MELNFTIQEFCILEGDIPQVIADKILKYHILPLQASRNRINRAISVSHKAGYRPVFYEIQKGRSGGSEHCFKEDSKGGVDLVHIDELLEDLKANSQYTRICYYKNNGFIHCDYASPTSNRRYYECDSLTSAWKFKNNL